MIMIVKKRANKKKEANKKRELKRAKKGAIR